MLESIVSIIISLIRSVLTVDIVIIALAAVIVYTFMVIVFHFVSGRRIKYK